MERGDMEANNGRDANGQLLDRPPGLVDKKKVINGWAMYDWANSVYSLVITTAIFPIYYQSITSTPGGDQQVIRFFGLAVDNVSLQSYALSAAFLIAALISPLLSGIADYSGKKKLFMKFFCYLGSLSCIGLALFRDMATLEVGILFFVLAGIGFTGSIVFYNAYLPEIASPEEQDRVSARGYAFGYIGSVLLLLVNLAMVMEPQFFWLKDAGQASRASFVMTGIWWMGFAQITFARLPKNVYRKKGRGHYLSSGYREIMKVLRQLTALPVLSVFLIGFFTFSMGLQTVMYLAPTFAEKEINMTAELLIALMLILQIVAIFGAWFFSFLSSRLGNLKALMVAVVIWALVICAVYFVYEVAPFLVIAGIVGFIMGGSQALSRSTYSKMLPETTDHASFFSFYDIAEKVAIVLGTLTFGLINELTGTMRNSILMLMSFFIIAFALFFIIDNKSKKA